MEAFKPPAKKAGAVKPFNGDEETDEEEVRGIALIGPFHAGCCVVEILGPVQLLFAFLAAVAAVFLIVEWWREGYDTLRTLSGLALVFVCLYLVWLGKAIYLLRAFRKEIEKYRGLNQQLQGEVQELGLQNRAHSGRNAEQEQLSRELRGRVGDLQRVEQQLSVLSTECQGNVLQAQHVLQRLERSVKLDTVNSALLFFDKADRNRDGRVDSDEVGHFVDSLGFLWQHLPGFDTKAVQASIERQGGLSLDQVHELVDGLMLDLESGDPAALARRLEGTLMQAEPSDEELDRSARTICPPVR